MSAERRVTVVVVGGGHNGLAMSRCLSDRGVDHAVLERSEVANSWPNWQARLPGRVYDAVRTVSDGEWRTLDARGLYRQAKAAGVEYQAHLRAGLRASLGVEFGEVDVNGQADVVGIDDSVLVEFSTRSVDIETELANWVAGFVEREGHRPSPVEVGKAHKTITIAEAIEAVRDEAMRSFGVVDEQLLAASMTVKSPPWWRC